jgi:hypothetical protein
MKGLGQLRLMSLATATQGITRRWSMQARRMWAIVRSRLWQVASAGTVAALLFVATPAGQANAYGTRHSTQYGLDSCSAPTVSQMATLWNGSPYWIWYIYVGGLSRGCQQPNLNSSWVSQVLGQGWGLVPIWVGPQDPCTTYAHKFSLNTTTAYQQGWNEAGYAYTATMALGFSTDFPIVYDLEGYGPNSTCRNAAKAFIQGWVNNLHTGAPQVAGVYGSSCDSNLNDLASLAPPPDWIWGGDWSGNPSTSTLTCVGSGYWVNQQRHKQYQGPHNYSWNGVTVNVDSDCANGPIYALYDQGGNSTCP